MSEPLSNNTAKKTTSSNQRIWMIAGVLIVLAAGFFYYRSQNAAPLTTYKSVRAERKTLSLTSLSTGGVKPETRVDIKPSIAGRAEQVLVKEGDRVRKGQTLVWMSSTERAALLDAARARGSDEAKKWEELYRPVPIVAPITGTIILRSIEAGQSFATTDAILAMSDRLTVEAQVDETDIAQIRPKQTAMILLDAYPNEKIEGKVEKIAYEAKTTNNVTTYNVVVVPLITPDFMRSGMTANVTFELSKKENVVVIPTEAIKSREGKNYVLTPTASGDSKLPPTEQEVVLGISDGKETEVMSGLDEGATILIASAQIDAPKKAGSNPFMPSRPNTRKK